MKDKAQAIVDIPDIRPNTYKYLGGQFVAPKIYYYDENDCIASGEVTASEVGEHFITFTLVEPEDRIWCDGTIEPKTINWFIEK